MFRPDLGFRIVCEQVSHHPPVSAFYGEGEYYTIHGSIQPKMKFWGKSIEVTPKGMITLNLKKSVDTNLKLLYYDQEFKYIF